MLMRVLHGNMVRRLIPILLIGSVVTLYACVAREIQAIQGCNEFLKRID